MLRRLLPVAEFPSRPINNGDGLQDRGSTCLTSLPQILFRKFADGCGDRVLLKHSSMSALSHRVKETPHISNRDRLRKELRQLLASSLSGSVGTGRHQRSNAGNPLDDNPKRREKRR